MHPELVGAQDTARASVDVVLPAHFRAQLLQLTGTSGNSRFCLIVHLD